ncbi:MAG: trigger factor family protein, partial [Alphaproteobacteria bacterium]|nr:trigger factor family protein [Alphaproteobacteria bacterium]
MFTKEKVKDLRYSLSGKISAEDLQKAADKVLTEFGKTAKLRGFRPGHIP